MEGGGNEQWGDKWEERFKHGAGSKRVLLLQPVFTLESHPHPFLFTVLDTQGGTRKKEAIRGRPFHLIGWFI